MSRELGKTQSKSEILIEALPFIRKFAGSRVCIKVGGELFEDLVAAEKLAEDLSFLKSVGIQVVLVHGGGPQITKALKTLGKEPKFIEGQRVTDEATLEMTAMVMMGKINTLIVSLLNKVGTKAVGLSGIDDSMIKVTMKDPDLGFVGAIQSINTAPIEHLLKENYIPVIAGLGVDSNGQIFNINADIAAGKIAAAVGAKKLIVLTNVEGLYESFGDKDSLISEIDTHGLIRLISTGKLTAGMIPKVEAIMGAIKAGVPHAHILDGRQEHAVLLEIFTPEGIGTMIKADLKAEQKETK